MSIQLHKGLAELRDAFFKLGSPRQLAALLDLEYRILIYHTRKSPAHRRYSAFEIPKSAGGTRKILAPISPLKIVQRKLAQVLYSVYSPRPSVQGFAQGCSIVSNARKHQKRRFVFNVDLKDFFPSINFGRVRGMFMAHPYQRNSGVATVLAQICCHNNQLPQGAPTSPIISNMICAKLDSELQRLAKKWKCTYSRYADDITFSTNLRKFPTAIASPMETTGGEHWAPGEELEKLILSNGFQINQNKVRLSDQFGRQEVTGLTTNRFPNVTRTYIREIRAMLYDWRMRGHEEANKRFQEIYFRKYRQGGRVPKFKDHVRGRIEFIGMVRGTNDPIFFKFCKELEKLDPEFDAPPSKFERIRQALWVLESETTQGTAFDLEGIGTLTCAHVLDSPTYAYRVNEQDKRNIVKTIVSDKDIDLALIEIPNNAGPSLPKGDSTTIEFGDRITLAGFPACSSSDTGVFSPGCIVGWRKWFGHRRFRIDTAIVAGNSGGPVLNGNYEVIGIAVTGMDRPQPCVEFEVISIEELDLLLNSSRPS